MSDKTYITGTNKKAILKDVPKSHHIGGKKKRRRWKAEVYMTPTITGSKCKANWYSSRTYGRYALSKATIAKVNDSLDPYGF